MRQDEVRRVWVRMAAVCGACLLLPACMTTAPSGSPQAGTGGVPPALEVVERPEMEPMWADFVKYYYPNWRDHYWVDRGEWGNKGYMLGRPPETRRTGEMPRVQLADQVPYGLGLSESIQGAKLPSDRTDLAPTPPAVQPGGMVVPPLEDFSTGVEAAPPRVAPGPALVEPRIERTAPPRVTTRPPRPEPTPRRSAPTEYVVQKGDSLWSIASKVYGDPLGWVDIYRANQDLLGDSERIFPDQKLVIPAR